MFFRPEFTRSLIVLRTSPEPSPSVMRPARSTIETSPAWRTVAFTLIQYLRQSLYVLSDVNTLAAPRGAGNSIFVGRRFRLPTPRQRVGRRKHLPHIVYTSSSFRLKNRRSGSEQGHSKAARKHRAASPDLDRKSTRLNSS